MRRTSAIRAFAATLSSTIFIFGATASADLVLTMGGDVNFNKNRQLPKADGAYVGGSRVPFSNITKGIEPLIDGDLNFANIETVVTEKTQLRPEDKTFAFQSHPNAIRQLIRVGFNLFSLSNNHSYDYGLPGIMETWANIANLQREFPGVHSAGGGMNRHEALQPIVFEKNGYRIAFAAIGILDARFRATNSRPGFLHYTNEQDYNDQLQAFKNVKADLKIISIHTGTEAQITLDGGQRKKFNRAIEEAGIDLVIGHHPHVVRPIEMNNGKLIIYSLGNYMMLGASNIDAKTPGYDYGLFSRVYFGWDSATQRLKAQAMEVVPLKRMHIGPVPATVEVGNKRVDMLNALSRNQVGDRAVIFNKRGNGTGIACASADTKWTERAAKICGGGSRGTVLSRD